ncbi:protein NATD1 isoform X1 [Tachysurus ichikawai]
MAQAAQMNVIEINSPVRVEHDKKRRQFTIRLNGNVTFVTANPGACARERLHVTFVFIKSLSNDTSLAASLVSSLAP